MEHRANAGGISRETVLTVVAFLVISPEQYKGGGKKDPLCLSSDRYEFIYRNGFTATNDERVRYSRPALRI